MLWGCIGPGTQCCMGHGLLFNTCQRSRSHEPTESRADGVIEACQLEACRAALLELNLCRARAGQQIGRELPHGGLMPHKRDPRAVRIQTQFRDESLKTACWLQGVDGSNARGDPQL